MWYKHAPNIGPTIYEYKLEEDPTVAYMPNSQEALIIYIYIMYMS